jgi:uncharacterized protein YacL
MILAIVFAILAYKKAQASNRNGILWAAIAAGAFIGTQLVITFGVGILLGLGIAFLGWSDTILETYTILITIFAVIISIAVGYLILRYLDKVPEYENMSAPPPPPNFGGN